MSSDGRIDRSIVRSNRDLEIYLSKMAEEERMRLMAIFKAAIDDAKRIEVSDLWDQPELAVTYWILMLTGVNKESEMKLAQELLSWKEFFSKHSARVRCIQSSEREEFRCCSRSFLVTNFPALIFGNSNEMHSFIRIPSQLLEEIKKEEGGLQTFLTKIQALMENGSTLEEIEGMLLQDKVWKGVKGVYKELRGIITFQGRTEF